MRMKQIRLCAMLTALMLTSCNLLTPIIFVGEHRKRVFPEFDKLAHSRVAILVWTEAATLFDYPHVRFELASYIADKMDYEMSERKLKTEMVDPRDVEDFLQKNLDAQVDPQMVGRQFQADYVIYMEIIKFQIRDPAEPHFLQGKIHASVVVYDMRADKDQRQYYELTEVKSFFPDSAPVLMTANNSVMIREATYRKFAEEVARKFYEHTIEL